MTFKIYLALSGSNSFLLSIDVGVLDKNVLISDFNLIFLNQRYQ